MSHTALREAIDELDRRILADPENTPERFARMKEAQRDGGLLHGDRPICPFLRPIFLTRSEYRSVARAAEVVASAMERLVRVALEDPAILAELGLTPREIAMSRIDPGYRHSGLTTRLDTYLSEGDFGFLEYNGESPAGIGDQPLLQQLLFSLPLVKEFLEQHPYEPLDPQRRLLESLVNAYREWGGAADKPTIAIVDWSDVPTQAEFRLLQAAFESQGHRTLIADPADLSYDGNRLSIGQEPVDIVYKRVIIHEFLTRTGDVHPLARAYVDGRICMANAFRCKVAHKKASFAVLSDPRFARIFTDDQLAVAGAHIPWTRRVQDRRVDYGGEQVPMRDLLIGERERLVLKPNDDYGGHGVTIGYVTDEESWKRTVDVAFEDPWVVQALVPVRTEAIPHVDESGSVLSSDLTVDFDPFMFGGRVEGGMARLSGTALSNISAGGCETAVAVIGD